MEGNIFNTPPRDTDLHDEYREVKNLNLHVATLYDEEGSAHGGEAINPETGLPNVNVVEEPEDTLATARIRDMNTEGDIMGNIPDPSKMTLKELLESADDSLPN